MGNRFLRRGISSASPLLRDNAVRAGDLKAPSSRSVEARLQPPKSNDPLLAKSQQQPQQGVSTTADKSGVRVTFDRSTHKRCIKCKEVKPFEEFGFHGDSHTKDNRQSVCTVCKTARAKERVNQDPRKRLRHHIATRVKTQLGDLCPEGMTANLDTYLGYSMTKLVRHLVKRLQEDFPNEGLRLREVLDNGWHVDHLYPLSRFAVVVGESVDWDEFRRCWAVENLAAIPAADNLAKGAKVLDFPLERDSTLTNLSTTADTAKGGHDG